MYASPKKGRQIALISILNRLVRTMVRMLVDNNKQARVSHISF